LYATAETVAVACACTQPNAQSGGSKIARDETPNPFAIAVGVAEWESEGGFPARG
jgi:hypothetical protein